MHTADAKKLQTIARWTIGRGARRETREFHFRAEGAGIQRAAVKFLKRFEVAELRPLRLVVGSRGVMHVGAHPHHITNILALDKTE